MAGVLIPDAAPGASRGSGQHLQAQARAPLLTHQLGYGVHSQPGDRLTVHRQQDVAKVQGTAPAETSKAGLGRLKIVGLWRPLSIERPAYGSQVHNRGNAIQFQSTVNSEFCPKCLHIFVLFKCITYHFILKILKNKQQK